MIKIDNIDISISDFRLLDIDGSIDLTTAESQYQKCPNYLDGGIKVRPKYIDIDVKSGTFLITQICEYHLLEISTVDKICKFDSAGKQFKDTISESNCHYDSFKIIDNKIYCEVTNENEVVFWDAPFMELLKLWTEINYEIRFVTCFQYRDDKDMKIIPLLSFVWFLKAHAKKQDNKWEIISKSHSDDNFIKKSLKYFQLGEFAVLPCNLPQLYREVRNFKDNKLQ